MQAEAEQENFTLLEATIILLGMYKARIKAFRG